MADAKELLALADRVQAASGADKALLREVALAVGWHRYSPSEIGASKPGWIAPKDFCGEYVGKDGRRSPKLDSLHGTSIWRQPRDYLTSLDAAMSLVPEGASWSLTNAARLPRACVWAASPLRETPPPYVKAATPALALTAAALRARAQVRHG